MKLMGRHSGFISLHASIASGDANVVLLPEVSGREKKKEGRKRKEKKRNC